MLTQEGSTPKSVSGIGNQLTEKHILFLGALLEILRGFPVDQKRPAMTGRDDVRLEFENVANRFHVIAAFHFIAIDQVMAKIVGIIRDR